MRPDRPEVDIVIVDYRAGELLHDCLASLVAHPLELARLASVTVVDNAPDGGSTPAAVPGVQVTTIANPCNRGFAAACNQGAARGQAKYILFLNPDTRLLHGSVDIPVTVLERDDEEKTGIAGVQLVDEADAVGITCYQFPQAAHFLWKAIGFDRIAPDRFPSGGYSGFDHRTTRQVDQVMGAFFLVRRTVFEQLGGFDERFFVYFEEMDFSKRAAQAGFRSMFIAEARAFHAGCGTTSAIRGRRLFYSVRSRLQYADKHFTAAGRALAWAVSLGIEPLARAVNALRQGGFREFRETMSGYRMLGAWLMGLREAE